MLLNFTEEFIKERINLYRQLSEEPIKKYNELISTHLSSEDIVEDIDMHAFNVYYDVKHIENISISGEEYKLTVSFEGRTLNEIIYLPRFLLDDIPIETFKERIDIYYNKLCIYCLSEVIVEMEDMIKEYQSNIIEAKKLVESLSTKD